MKKNSILLNLFHTEEVFFVLCMAICFVHQLWLQERNTCLVRMTFTFMFGYVRTRNVMLTWLTNKTECSAKKRYMVNIQVSLRTAFCLDGLVQNPQGAMIHILVTPTQGFCTLKSIFRFLSDINKRTAVIKI